MSTMTHSEMLHPRGADGRWVTKQASAPAATLPTVPKDTTGLQQIQHLMAERDWDDDTLEAIADVVARSGRSEALCDDPVRRRRWRPSDYADPLDRLALALRHGQEEGWRRADQMQALDEALKPRPRQPPDVDTSEWATALWDLGIVREPSARELDLDGAAQAGFDPQRDSLEDWRLLAIDEDTWIEEASDLDGLRPDDTGSVLVLDEDGEYWARREDGMWSRTDPHYPGTEFGFPTTSDDLAWSHGQVVRVSRL